MKYSVEFKGTEGYEVVVSGISGIIARKISDVANEQLHGSPNNPVPTSEFASKNISEFSLFELKMLQIGAVALNRGNKIEAIKFVRTMTGLGLKEAKDYVESVSVGGSQW